MTGTEKRGQTFTASVDKSSIAAVGMQKRSSNVGVNKGFFMGSIYTPPLWGMARPPGQRAAAVFPNCQQIKTSFVCSIRGFNLRTLHFLCVCVFDRTLGTLSDATSQDSQGPSPPHCLRYAYSRLLPQRVCAPERPRPLTANCRVWFPPEQPSRWPLDIP